MPGLVCVVGAGEQKQSIVHADRAPYLFSSIQPQIIRLFIYSLVLIELGCNPELWLGAKQAHSHWVPSLALVDDFKIKT